MAGGPRDPVRVGTMMVGTTVGAVLRSNQAYQLQLSRAESLACGVAYTCTRFPDLCEANQLCELMVRDEGDIPEAYAAVEDYFAERGLRCFRWAPAADQPYEALGQYLWERGYRRRDLLACALTRWPERPPGDDLRILPARPMRELYRQTFLDPGGPYASAHQEACAEAGLERLDEPSFEAHVGLVGGRPAGRCALFQVGDIGRVVDLYVLSGYRGRGVGACLLGHVLGIAQRFMARTVCLEVEADNAAARRCVQRMGFVEDGRLVEFDHPDAAAARLR